MKASTALEALYPAVQKKYGNARYGANDKGKMGIDVLFPNGRAFISDDDFDELVKDNPGENAEKLLFNMLDAGDKDEMRRRDVLAGKLQQVLFPVIDKGMSQLHENPELRKRAQELVDSMTKEDEERLGSGSWHVFDAIRNRLKDMPKDVPEAVSGEAADTRKNLLNGIQDKML